MTIEKTGKEVTGRQTVAALVALLALTLLSFGLSFAPLGVAGPVLAFGIAGGKVLIVGFIFMHLREAVFATKLVALVSALYIALICVGIFADVGFR